MHRAQRWDRVSFCSVLLLPSTAQSSFYACCSCQCPLSFCCSSTLLMSASSFLSFPKRKGTFQRASPSLCPQSLETGLLEQTAALPSSPALDHLVLRLLPKPSQAPFNLRKFSHTALRTRATWCSLKCQPGLRVFCCYDQGMV